MKTVNVTFKMKMPENYSEEQFDEKLADMVYGLGGQVLDVKPHTSEKGEMLKVETPLGTLIATPTHDEDYPCISIDIQRKDVTIQLMAVECQLEDEELNTHSLRAYVYGDKDTDEPSKVENLTQVLNQEE